MKKENSIITIFILITIVLLVIVSACIFVFSKIKPEQKIITQNTPVIEKSTVKKMEGVVIESTEFDTYRNEKFGFEFQFPKDWAIRESVFRSATSQFNLVIEPTQGKFYPYPLTINIVPSDWIDKIEKNLELKETVIVNNRSMKVYKVSSEGLPQFEYITSLDDELTITIGGKEEYKIELDKLINSFKFLK